MQAVVSFGLGAAAWPQPQGSMKGATAASCAKPAAPPGLRMVSCSLVSSAAHGALTCLQAVCDQGQAVGVGPIPAGV